MLRTGTAEETCNSLIELTLERGAIDNVTAIVVDIE
jgi:serine/threonine protein phosphatase PrpC